MERTVAILNGMVRDGIVPAYAIGGGIGALFYVEPFETHDLDVFVELPQKSGVVSLEPITHYLLEKGCSLDGELFWIEGIPVQFLPVTHGLVEEAVAKASPVRVGSQLAQVLRPEHLVALMTQLGRPAKDIPRIALFLEQAPLDRGLLQEILERHDLVRRWEEIVRRLDG